MVEQGMNTPFEFTWSRMMVINVFHESVCISSSSAEWSPDSCATAARAINLP